jgi:AP-3 complex subunit delta-1
MEMLEPFTQAQDLEVQERAISASALLKYVSKQRVKGVNIDHEVAQLYEGDLNPVAAKAQRKVPIPEGLDLEKWINPPPKEDAVKDVEQELFNWMDTVLVDESLFKVESDDEETKQDKREQRKVNNTANPFHLGDRSSAKADSRRGSLVELESRPTSPTSLDDVGGGVEKTVKKLDLSIGSIFVDGLRKKKKKKRLTKKQIKKLKKKGLPIPVESDSEPEPEPVQIAAAEEMPEGAEVSDGEADEDRDAIYNALDINLDQPLTDQDRTLVGPASHHVAKSMTAEEAEKLDKKKAKEAKKAKKLAQKIAQGLVEDPAVQAKKDKKAAKKAKKKAKAEAKDGGEDGGEGGAEEGAAAADGGEEDVVEEEKQVAEAVAAKEAEVVPEKEEGGKKKKDKKSKKSKVPTSTALDLAKDKVLKVTYEAKGAKGAEGHESEVVLSIKNKGDSRVSNLELCLPDCDVATLVGDGSGTVQIPFDLEAGKKEKFTFAIDVAAAGPAASVAGSIKYAAGTSQAALDFTMPVTDAALCFPQKCSGDEFKELVSNTELMTAKDSVKISTGGKSFGEVLDTVCATVHLTAVEKMDDAASMYGMTTSGIHLLFLMKQLDGDQISLSGKSSDADMLAKIIALITAALA